MSDNDNLDTARKFNEAVSSTAVVGALVEKVSDTNDRLTRMEPKLDKVVHTIDRYSGVMVVVGTLASIAASLVVGFLLSLIR